MAQGGGIYSPMSCEVNRIGDCIGAGVCRGRRGIASRQNSQSFSILFGKVPYLQKCQNLPYHQHHDATLQIHLISMILTSEVKCKQWPGWGVGEEGPRRPLLEINPTLECPFCPLPSQAVRSVNFLISWRGSRQKKSISFGQWKKCIKTNLTEKQKDRKLKER